MRKSYTTINERQLELLSVDIKQRVSEITHAIKALMETNNTYTITRIKQQIYAMQNDLHEVEKAYSELKQLVEYERSEML